MFRIVTMSGEYGAGSREMARRLSEKLGWRLLDHALIEEIARQAEVDPNLAEQYDERVDPWLHRLARQGLWYGGFEAAATMGPAELFDAERMFELTRRLIVDAGEIGECVVVGRGGQCILQDRPDCFHVFVYAPLEFRIQTVKAANVPARNYEELVKTRDTHRDAYIRQHFGQNRRNLHLYHLALSGELGVDFAVPVITCAVRGSTL